MVDPRSNETLVKVCPHCKKKLIVNRPDAFFESPSEQVAQQLKAQEVIINYYVQCPQCGLVMEMPAGVGLRVADAIDVTDVYPVVGDDSMRGEAPEKKLDMRDRLMRMADMLRHFEDYQLLALSELIESEEVTRKMVFEDGLDREQAEQLAVIRRKQEFLSKVRYEIDKIKAFIETPNMLMIIGSGKMLLMRRFALLEQLEDCLLDELSSLGVVEDGDEEENSNGDGSS